MTRGPPFNHLQFLYPQFTATALLWDGCGPAHSPVLVSLSCLGCLAWGLES